MLDCRPHHELVDLPLIGDGRGLLLVAEAHAQVPFDIRRLFVLLGLPPGARRGAHAHRQQHQFLIMLAGACDVDVYDGRTRSIVHLDTPNRALYVPPMLWLDLGGFTPASVCAVLTSGAYDAKDYIRDAAEFDRLTAMTT